MRPPGRLFSLAPPPSPPGLLTLPRQCCRFAGGRYSPLPLPASCVSLAARARAAHDAGRGRRRAPLQACALFSTSASPVWSASTAASTGTGTTKSTTAAAAAEQTPADAQGATNADGSRLRRSYFLSNGVLARIAGFSGASFPSSLSSSPSSSDTAEAALRKSGELAPHRRRQAARRQAEAETQAAAASPSSPSAGATATAAAKTASVASEDALPTSSITILSDMAAQQPATSVRRVASALLALTKPRLTVLVVLTAMAPYALYPVPAFLSPELTTAAAAPSLSPLTLLFLTVGTALCSAAANALNMLYEPATDARMARTRNRPLVRQLLSRRAALAFAAACAVAGVAALQLGVNPTVAFLGAANIALYAGVYTPMKRLSAANTWVGAVVGGIPPLMGWAAAAGETATGGASAAAGTDSNDAGRPHHSEFRELLFAPDGSSAGGWLLAGLLFAWQFPHFMALSWGVRADYRRAGLRMLCWVNPARNGRVALRYSLAFVPLCVGLCAVGVTEWSFAATSLPANLWLAREAVRFWRCEGHQGTARRLFWASVWHLPAVMVLALLQKKGMWARVYRSVVGAPAADEDADEDEDEDEDALYDDYDDAVWEGVGAGAGAGAEGKPGPVREGEGP